MTWDGCTICGRVEHADWCEFLKGLMRERDAGGPVQSSWPSWLTATPEQHAGNWGPNPTHCPEGHELTPLNFYVSPDGTKTRCRTCFNVYYREYRARRRRVNQNL